MASVNLISNAFILRSSLSCFRFGSAPYLLRVTSHHCRFRVIGRVVLCIALLQLTIDSRDSEQLRSIDDRFAILATLTPNFDNEDSPNIACR